MTQLDPDYDSSDLWDGASPAELIESATKYIGNADLAEGDQTESYIAAIARLLLADQLRKQATEPGDSE